MCHIFFQLNLISNQLKGTKKRLKRSHENHYVVTELIYFIDFVKSNVFWWQEKNVLQMTLRILNYMILKNHHNMMTQMGGITILLTRSWIVHIDQPLCWMPQIWFATSLHCHSAPPNVVPITRIDENSGARFFINIDLGL